MLKQTIALVMLTLSFTTQAALYSVTLSNLNWGDAHGETSGYITGIVSGVYDTTTGIVSMDAGVTSFAYYGWGGLMYSDEHTNWSTGNDNYAADSYVCSNASASLNFCGSYYYGQNRIDESTMDYSTMPGIRTLGGDDVADPDPEHLIIQGDLYAVSMTSFDGVGGNLIMHSNSWLDPDPQTSGDALFGIEMVFSVDNVVSTPVPATAWLFGSALIGLVGIKRKK
ncbi:hypothetical protein [Oceanicoccus sp. KOV_DT_Chl]|uniref:hypothetical protein n=1 Tax=Oceanicoccus sp. KOV_DT_Chl TaxID=1904639 RepID=UPI000C7D6EEB|nr:hypothetical protein [Oceanicoccus sp. KOV_DT_Chl]